MAMDNIQGLPIDTMKKSDFNMPKCFFEMNTAKVFVSTSEDANELLNNVDKSKKVGTDPRQDLLT